MNSAIDTCFKEGGTILSIDQHTVNNVIWVGMVTIAIPSALMLRLVTKSGIHDEKFVGGTEIQKPLPIFINLIDPMWAKNCMPGIGVSSSSSIEVTVYNDHVSSRDGRQNRVQIIVNSPNGWLASDVEEIGLVGA